MISLQIGLKNGIHLAFGIKDKCVFFWDLTSLTYKEKVNVPKEEFKENLKFLRSIFIIL